MRDEDDISAEEKVQSESTWISQKNADCGWQKGSLQKESKRQKENFCVKL